MHLKVMARGHALDFILHRAGIAIDEDFDHVRPIPFPDDRVC